METTVCSLNPRNPLFSVFKDLISILIKEKVRPEDVTVKLFQDV